MNRVTERYLQQQPYHRLHQLKKHGTVLLAFIILITTTRALILPAFTQKKDVFCGLEEHVHTEECYEKQLICGQEEDETHTHDDSCYETVLTCDQPEHTHTLDCYSDPAADIETEQDWIQSMPSCREEESPAERLIGIARSQLGYRESELNYKTNDNGTLNGYTRYGQWRDQPYADWNALFVSFCLHYADIQTENAPYFDNAGEWKQRLQSQGRYLARDASAYQALPGDLLFFRCDDGSEHVGIVVQTKAEQIEVIAGDQDGEVRDLKMDIREERVEGYGLLPVSLRPETAETEDSEEETAVTEAIPNLSAEAESEPEEQPETGKLIAETNGVTVTAETGLSSEGLHLEVSSLEVTDEDVSVLEEALSEQLPDGIEKHAHVDPDTVQMLEISIVDEDGETVECEEEVILTIRETDPETDIVALDETGAVPLETEQTPEGVTFTAASSGVYAFGYTVDFYVEGFEYHMSGGSYILLSELIDALSLSLTAEEIESVDFSDRELLSVIRIENDWILNSLKPFDSEEELILTLHNGDVYCIKVLDAKTYSFQFNVNDSAAGYAYNTSKNYGESINLAVQDSGLSAGSVRPRSSSDPFNGHYSAAPGYEFRYWMINGYQYFGRGEENPGSYADLYSIHPQVGISGVPDRAATFTACFAPAGEHIIVFDKYIKADTDGRVYGSVTHGDARHYEYLNESGETESVYYCYSGSSSAMLAEPFDNGVFVGWYESGTDNLICESLYFVPPADLNRDITVQAKFRKAGNVTVTYYSYDSRVPEYRIATITIRNQGPSGTTVSEEILENHVPSGAIASVNTNYEFVCWRDEDGKVLTRDKELILYYQVTSDTEYKAEYLETKYERILLRSNNRSYGSVWVTEADWTDTMQGYDLSEGNIVLRRTITAKPEENYRFDHWELNGKRFSYDTEISVRNLMVSPDRSTHVQELTAVFRPICHITYDLSQIQQVGNNSADYQHWEDVSWCSKDVYVDRDGLVTLGEDLYQETKDFGAQFTFPDLTKDTRVSQTNNGYNLLTHTFKGWRIEGDSTNTIYHPGDTITVYGQLKLNSVWDAYFDGKNGYYNAGDAAVYRYNTNTCGFFVRLFDTTFDIGDTSTYTDCLFTTRLIGDPLYSGNGHRDDFYGYSEETDRDNIDAYDAYLRQNAASGIVAKTNSQFANSVMKLDLPFPSDEFMFGRLREWNAEQIEKGTGRRIQINGQDIPQEQLTTDYYDLRWYVLKDQENSWHIDGMLIPKYAKLVVTKSFVGEQSAIDYIKQGNFFIGVDEDENTAPTENAKYKLNLNVWAWDNPGGYRYIDGNGQYVWVMDDLMPLTSYWVAEKNYTAQSPYKTSKNYLVFNTTQENQSGSSYHVKVEKVYSYADDIWVDGIQTVAYTNRYTKPRELSLIKTDGFTGNPLSKVNFHFILYANQGDGTIIEIPVDGTTDKDGRISIEFPEEFEWEGRTVRIPAYQEGGFNGKHRFRITERAHAGYQSLSGDITGTITLYDDKEASIELDITTDPAYYVDTDSDGSGATLYVKNEPIRKHVTVNKTWIGSESRPVNMQLMRNGVAWLGKNITLGADAARVQQDPEHNTTEWTYTWTNLPAYVDGDEATYTTREEWIGIPGGTDSVHYNTANDSDGYSDYIVTQSQTADGYGNVTVYVENNPDEGQVIFSKIDENQRAVPGAEFTVYTDSNCTIPISESHYREASGKARPSVFISDQNGMVTIKGLRNGTYYLKETKAPSGYVLEDDRIFKLTVNSRNSSLVYEDPGTGQTTGITQVSNPVYSAAVTIQKIISGTSTPLAGAVFSLHASREDGMDPSPMRGFDQLTSKSDGKINLGYLKRGVYYLVEDEAPPGYDRITEPIRITIPDSSATRITAIKSISHTGLPVSESGVITVANSAGVVLPETGGTILPEQIAHIGDLLLYGVMIAVISIAMRWLLRRKERRKYGCAKGGAPPPT